MNFTAEQFRTMAATDTGRFEPRVRFNWGYGDGAADARRGRDQRHSIDTHYDYFYSCGYEAGYDDHREGEDTSDSTEAWLMHYGHEVEAA